MLLQHFLFALRLIARHRAFAFITVGGLALGMAGCLMIRSYVRYERGYETWLPDHARVFQVQATWHEPAEPVVQAIRFAATTGLENCQASRAMRDWLNGFEARIPLGPGRFVIAGLLALLIALATVAGQAIRAARLNPVHALRHD